MYLLDTNVISEMRKIKNGKAKANANANVVAWLAQQNPENLYTCAVVAMELEHGVLAMERKDKLQGIHLREWKNAVLAELFANKILPIDAETAQICARLHIPDQSSENDAWIASSAIQHNLILVTHNVADFARTGVKLLNPFAKPAK